MTDEQTPSGVEEQAERRVEEIGAELAAQVTTITVVLHDELVERIEDLQDDPAMIELLRASTQGNLETVAHLVQGHVPFGHLTIPTTATEYARRLAQRGIGLDALLRAYRLGQRRFLEWALERLACLESDDAVRFAAARSLTALTFEYVDLVAEGVVDTYQVEREQWLASRNTVRTEILASLLAGQQVDLGAAEAGLGHRLRQHHLGMVLWHRRPLSAAGELRELEAAAVTVGRCVGAKGSPLFVSRDRTTGWAWLSLGRSADSVDIEAVTAAVGADHPDVRVALGTVGPGEDGFRSTHAEALKAQQVAMVGEGRVPSVACYGDAGVRAAALLTADLAETQRLVATALGGLAADTDNAARLRETLQTFLRCNDSYVATAERVHLHKNTVKYRVDKAVAARGRPLGEDRLDLELALVACQWLAPAVLHEAD